jgi:altronate dehydratase small subunit
MELKEKAIVLNAKDNVATALIDLEEESSVGLDVGGKTLSIKLASRIPFGHKFSLAHIEAGAPVIKYGEVIGTASAAINPGDYVHVQNVESTRGGTGDKGGVR